MLRSADLSQRYYAAWWLGKMRVHSAVPALLVALQDEEDRTALGAILCGVMRQEHWASWGILQLCLP